MNKIVLYFLNRFFRSPKKEWLRFDSIFMILGVIISVATLTVALAIFEGYENVLKNTILNVNSHIYIYNREDANLNNEHLQELENLLEDQEAFKNAGKIIINQSMAVAGKRVKGSIIRGVEWQKELPNSYKRFVYQGDYKLEQPHSAVLGYRLAKELNLALGDTFKIINPSGSKITAFGVKHKEQEFTLVGLYKSGMYEYDSKYVFIDFSAAADFYEIENEFTMYEVALKTDFIDRATELAFKWNTALDYNYQINSWIDFNGNLFSLLTIEKWVIFIILSFLILIASFNVVSSVTTSILERKQELGILKTLGASNFMLRRIFLFRFMLIALVTVSCGQFVGFFIAKFLSWQNFFMLRGEVYFLDSIYIDFSLFSWLAVLGTALALIFISILIPLKKVNRLNIINILRN